MPTEPAPAVRRAAQIMRVLASEPRPWPLAEVVRATGHPRASCQSVLLALAGEGLVVREEPGPTYRLGPDLVGLGLAARAGIRVLDVVGSELTLLHQSLGLSALAGLVAGDSIVVGSVRAVPDEFGHVVTEGSRIPLRAPLGGIYVAWAPQPEIETWLDRSDPSMSERERVRLTDDLEAIRSRGWSATVRPARRGDRGATREVREAELGDRAAPLAVVGVSAPVWDAGGRLACSLALAAFPGTITTADLLVDVDALLGAAARSTAAIGGRAPVPSR